MKRRGPRLHLVGQDPAEVFDDLNKLRSELATPPQRRPKLTETFARVPHDKALALLPHKLGYAAWHVLIELDRLILKHRGHNPVKFVSSRLRKGGLHHESRTRGLRQLARAGVVRITQRGRGLAPWVTHLWYPLSEP